MLRLFRVKGDSMTPDYRNGDLAVVLSRGGDQMFGRSLKPGDDVIAHHPDHGVILKRVNACGEGGGVQLTGLSSLSTAREHLRLDSQDAVVGRVIYSFG